MPLFNFFTPRQPPAPKRFTLNEYYEFDSINQFCLMICAADWPKDFLYTISADPDGRIELHVSGDIGFFPEMLQRIDPSVAAFFCSKDHYSMSGNYGTMRFSFHEPGCYIYGCPQGPFQQEVSEYAPSGYVDFFRKYPNGSLQIIVKFREQDEDERYARFLKLKDRCDIFLK